MMESDDLSTGRKQDRPKILAIDLDPDVEAALSGAGFNVSIGSFGTPYTMPVGDGMYPVVNNGHMPENVTEQEIVIIDLRAGELEDGPSGEKHTSPGSDDWWVSAADGLVDPRPRLTAAYRNAFDKVQEHGGIFVIFAEPRRPQKCFLGHLDYFETVKTVAELEYDNWSFLSILARHNLGVEAETGEEISFDKVDIPLVDLVQKFAKDGSFNCVLTPRNLSERSSSLAVNKYGAYVALAIIPVKSDGWVIILPDLRNKGGFLVELLKHVLPPLVPELFPHAENASWANDDVYEFAEIQKLKSEIDQVILASKEEVANLQQKISDERASREYLIELLRATGQQLVVAVKRALEVLGFTEVVDVDEAEGKDDDGFLLEDLRIEDSSPVLLVEVKGVNGKPADDDAMQVQKNVIHRVREWERFDIQGLTIINHERHLPPLDRENKSPFRDVILTNAIHGRFGLLTTWDLARLIRSFLKLGWSPDDVKAVLYRVGRIDPVPEHYEYVGHIQDFWEKASVVSILVEGATLRSGDRIGFELPIEFEEQDNTSMQMDHKPVEEAEAGMLVALETTLTKTQAKKGTRVYRVKRPQGL